MTFVENLIKSLYPTKLICYRLSDLIDQLPDHKINGNHIIIAIETNNHSRRFCYLTLNELMCLFERCPVHERCLFELISPGYKVKTYIDFEYYIHNNVDIESSKIGPGCCLKILHLLLSFGKTLDFGKEKNDMESVFKQFLVLDASTTEKVSYHFIHSKPTVMFENNSSLGLFIKVVMHLFLWSIYSHKCASFNIDEYSETSDIFDLIDILGKHAKSLRTNCTKCFVYANQITMAEIAHLLVLDKNNQYTLAIDLNVYSRNQQFRLFDCVKRNKINPLIQSSIFQSQQHSKIPYFDILKESLVTYHSDVNLPILCYKNDQFVFENCDIIESKNEDKHPDVIMNIINSHLNIFNNKKCHLIHKPSFVKLNDLSTNIIYSNRDDLQEQIEKFTPFVQKLIKTDVSHPGFVRSCVRGNRNLDVLFFNIGGEYRYCPYKGRHHERNTISILIDTNNCTFSIRCKDADCFRKNLVWKKIE